MLILYTSLIVLNNKSIYYSTNNKQYILHTVQIICNCCLGYIDIIYCIKIVLQIYNN